MYEGSFPTGSTEIHAQCMSCYIVRTIVENVNLKLHQMLQFFVVENFCYVLDILKDSLT